MNDNPDYQKLKQENQKLKELATGKVLQNLDEIKDSSIFKGILAQLMGRSMDTNKKLSRTEKGSTNNETSRQ